MDLAYILQNCTTLNDIATIIYNKKNYNTREKVKRLLAENSIDWKEWLHSKKKIKYCLNCGKEIIGKNKTLKKFCNSSCSASYNNKLRKETKFCLHCGRPLVHNNKKFCNSYCQASFEYKKWIFRWKAGEESGLRGKYGISQHLKRYLFEKYNYKCARCGWGEKNPHTNTIPLEVEHIDGDFTNNKGENLILLCPNCHSLTSTYKGANKGNGRKERKKYSK